MPLVSKNIYLPQNSSNIIELEAKIVSQIAKAFVFDPKIYIIGSNEQLNSFFSLYSKLSSSCEDANFIYIKNELDINKCKNKRKFFFTDNKKTYKKNSDILGAFFWFKSRPNIKISSSRARKYNLIIPSDYKRFVDK